MCVSTCIDNVAQIGCDSVAEACRGAATTGRCSELNAVCDAMPTEPNCGGSGDAGTDVLDDTGVDAGPCGECSAPTPLCDESSMMCVQCLSETDCDGDELCDDAGTCVECLEHSDCPDPAMARCESSTGTCQPCDDTAQCTEDAQNLCSAGVCLQCSEATAETHCGDNSCDPATGTCTETMRESLEACEACVSDTECETGHHCVPMTYMDADRGGYCLPFLPLQQPFSIPITRSSLSGEPEQMYAGINEALTTCEAVRALLDNQVCVTDDSECPEGGLCRDLGFGDGNRCTYECGGEVQCDAPPNPGSSCGDGSTGEEDYCGG